jgi:hypothetical protein
MRISFLHTIDGNQAVFEHAAINAGLLATQLRHDVRPDLREAVGQGLATDGALRDQVRDVVRNLAEDADAVIVTCATLGPVVDSIQDWPAPVIRADVALAKAAATASAGKPIVVLCAVASTVDTNRALFEQHAQASGASVAVRLVPDAWAMFQAGDRRKRHMRKAPRWWPSRIRGWQPPGLWCRANAGPWMRRGRRCTPACRRGRETGWRTDLLTR